MSKIKNPEILRGIDWTELGVLWGFKESLSDKAMSRKIKQYIVDSYHSEALTNKAAGDVRKFLKLLIKNSWGYGKPVWKGLLAVKDNYTLLQFTRELLESMWS